jgi:thioredoxin-related protein
MKAKAVIFALLTTLFTYSAFAQEEGNWLTNLEEAQNTAQKENKYIIMNFSGSDWCTNCKRLHKSLFETDAFKSYADNNLILLNLDFPAKKKNLLPKEQQKYNDALAEKYNKSGRFPTVLVLTPEGKIKGKLTYPQMEVNAYLTQIDEIINQP